MERNYLDGPVQAMVCHPLYQEMRGKWIGIRRNVWQLELQFEGRTDEEGTGIEISWKAPVTDVAGRWHPICGCDRTLKADWDSMLCSMNAISAPVCSFFNEKDENRYTLALSETQRIVHMGAGVHEEDGTILFTVRIASQDLRGQGKYALTLYWNEESALLSDVLRQVSLWWEKVRAITPMEVPEQARRPVYSTWYSFHQNLDEKSLEEEARRAKEMGFATMIVDDGWQTDDSGRGYAYCGDWEPAEEKFPDMAGHVERVHRIGLKYMLWFSVPFVGVHSQKWKDFSDRLIYFDSSRQAGVLDIRFPEVREYLLSCYRRAVRDWKIDGLKLDFIDEFYFRNEKRTEAAGISCDSMQEALELLLRETVAELKKLNPEILIEFRQRYIGPDIRKYENIFRVTDCPESGMSNRIGSVDLRLLSQNTAVHSDMIMWNRAESAENAAIQLQNAIFATPQTSVRLDRLSGEQRKMLAFWISFCGQKQELLQKAPIFPEQIGQLYPVVRARTAEEEAVAVYGRGVLPLFRRCHSWHLTSKIPVNKWGSGIFGCLFSYAVV